MIVKQTYTPTMIIEKAQESPIIRKAQIYQNSFDQPPELITIFVCGLFSYEKRTLPIYVSTNLWNKIQEKKMGWVPPLSPLRKISYVTKKSSDINLQYLVKFSQKNCLSILPP